MLQDEVGIRPVWLEKSNNETFAAIRTQFDEAVFDEAWEKGRALTLDEAVALALDSQD